VVSTLKSTGGFVTIKHMKIAVVAANGRTGQAFVRLALERGHSVRAGVHHNNPFATHKNLEVVTCDATDYEQVVALLKGQQAVVSLIGHVQGSSPTVQADATRMIVRAMKRLRKRRIVSLTGTGVRFPGDNVLFADRLLTAAITLIDPARIKDGDDHAEVLVQSNLDWTIIRVLKLMDGSARPFRLKAHGPTKLFVSRDEVAEAILEVLEKKSFYQAAPIIGT
jgi:putative NADH-flavin reductase